MELAQADRSSCSFAGRSPATTVSRLLLEGGGGDGEGVVKGTSDWSKDRHKPLITIQSKLY